MTETLKQFEKIFKEQVKQDSPIYSQQQKAFEAFLEKGLPSSKDEAWKYTSLKELSQLELSLPQVNAKEEVSLEPYLKGKEDWPRLVLLNGVYSEGLSDLKGLSEQIRVLPAKKLQPSDLSSFHSEKYEATRTLNTAFLTELIKVEIDANWSTEFPLLLLHLFTDKNKGSLLGCSRFHFQIGASSVLKIVEQFGENSSSESMWNNQYIVAELEANAKIDYLRLISEENKDFHTVESFVSQKKGSQWNSYEVTLGGRMMRHRSTIEQNESEASSNLNGFYYPKNGNHVDHQIVVNHRKPHGTSEQFFKGILEGESHAVFGGKAFVYEGAEKTDASQTNKNILLSEEAVVDTKPELEIYTDDVKCAHGAAVGQIDPKHLFYLQSRGISKERAERLLCHGFASEVLQKIPFEGIKQELSNKLLHQFEKV